MPLKYAFRPNSILLCSEIPLSKVALNYTNATSNKTRLGQNNHHGSQYKET